MGSGGQGQGGGPAGAGALPPPGGQLGGACPTLLLTAAEAAHGHTCSPLLPPLQLR